MPITRAYRLLGVSVSGFYAWRNSDKEHRFGVVYTDAFILETLKAEIKTACNGHIPGLLVCYRFLRQKGLSIDIKRLRRLMRAEGLFHRFHRKYVRTTDSDHDLPKAPNLLDRRFEEFGINEAWCGDITHIPTAEGWLYLTAVIDLGTRRLVGYCFDKHITKQLVINALTNAWENELPNDGCIFHSDQGSQYCSQAFQETLQNFHFRSSMSRRAQCWDNAAAEAFWATLKREALPLNGCFNSREEAKRQVQNWLYYYNGRRPHSKLGMQSPNEYYVQLLNSVK